MRTYTRFLILPLLVFQTFLSAEELPKDSITTKEPGKTSESLKAVGVTLEIPSLQFALQPVDGEKTHFRPNEEVIWGVEGAYEGYRAGVSIPGGLSKDQVHEKGKTSHFDIHLGKYFDQFGADFAYQRYEGFYLVNGDSQDSESGHIYPQRPDVQSRFYAANFFYSFSPKTYPLSDLTNLQAADAKKGGGWVAYVGLNEFSMRGDRPLVEGSGLTSAKLKTATLGGGYGYQWVKGGHHLSGFVLMGFGPQWQRLDYGNSIQKGVRSSDQLVMNASYSFHWTEWQSGFLLKLTTVDSNLGPSQKLTSTDTAISFFASRSL